MVGTKRVQSERQLCLDGWQGNLLTKSAVTPESRQVMHQTGGGAWLASAQTAMVPNCILPYGYN